MKAGSVSWSGGTAREEAGVLLRGGGGHPPWAYEGIEERLRGSSACGAIDDEDLADE
jgi:hypothetical protein